MKLSLSKTLGAVAVGMIAFLPTSAIAQLLPNDSPAAQDLQETLESQPRSSDEYVNETLNLTDDQARQIQAIFDRYQPSITNAVNDYLASLETLDRLLQPETPSEEIRRARNATLDKERVLDDLLFSRTMDVREVLTVDQRAQVNTYLRSLAELHAGEAAVASKFPDNLVGQPLDSVLSQLTADGWVVSARSGSSVFLDRNGQQLDLDIDNRNVVTHVFLR